MGSEADLHEHAPIGKPRREQAGLKQDMVKDSDWPVLAPKEMMRVVITTEVTGVDDR